MPDPSQPLSRLLTDAAGRLRPESPWLVVAAVPAHPAPAELPATSGEDLRRWLRQHVAHWPAPIAIGAEPPQPRPDGALAFAPSRHPGHPAAGGYYCEFHPDGSALAGLQVGTLRDSPADGRKVWALGEGAVAWITVALVRLLAANAARALGERDAELALEAALILATDPEHAAPIEVWNHAGTTYGPAGDRRLTGAASARHLADLATCLSPALTTAARPLIVDLLRRFGLSGSRHIDPAGVFRRDHFTGYDQEIHAWADAIGVPSRSG